MTTILHRPLNRAAFAILCFAAANGACAQSTSTPSSRPVMAMRLYTGADGLTHTDQVPINLEPAGKTGAEQSKTIPMAGSYLVRLAPGFFETWHNADHRRYVVTLGGRAEIEIAKGQKIYAEPGQIAIAEDLTGKGHTFRVVGNTEWVALFIDFAN